MVKILLIGDTHCGDKAGLTPPGLCVTEAQKALWLWWESFNAAHNSTPFDMVIFTGDMVEGQNNKNTIELYETDTEKQAEIAAECMGIIPCSQKAMFTVYGTPFHTAGTYSFENHFTDTLGIARPLTVHRIDVDGMVRLNVKHTVGRSSIPYGQGTPTYKEMVNEVLNAELSDDDAADIVIRGHAHYSVGMRVRDRAAIVVPCLKYPGSIFGRKLPEGQYDMGVGILEVYGKKDWRYIPVHIPVHVSSKREWIRWNQEQ